MSSQPEPDHQRPDAAPTDSSGRLDRAGSTQPVDSTDPTQNQKEWWDDPGMPWRHKPTRQDYLCLGWMGFMGVFGLLMLPLRGWLLGLDPPLLVALTGSRSGTAATGALASIGQASWWPLALVCGSLMSIKFDWVFWWAGKLWGRGMIEVWAGRSERAQRGYQRAERWAQKLGWVGIFAAYVPIPLPLMQVIFVLAGASRMSLRRFLVLDFVASTVWMLGFFGLGWAIGEPAVAVLKQYAKIANYVAIGLVVLVVGSLLLNGRRKATPPPAA